MYLKLRCAYSSFYSLGHHGLYGLGSRTTSKCLLSFYLLRSLPPKLADLPRFSQRNITTCNYAKKDMSNSFKSFYFFQCMRLSNSSATFSTDSNSSKESSQRKSNQNIVMYMVALAITVVGLSYAAVPLYRLFCQASGYGGTVVRAEASAKVEKMEPIRERELTVR